MSCIEILLSITLMFSEAAAPLGQVPSTTSKRAGLPADVSRFFEGSWSGEGTFVRSAKPVRSTFEFVPTLDREVMTVVHAEVPPLTFAYRALWSVDAGSGGLVMLMASNAGGGARLLRAIGWSGDRLVFTSDPALRASFAQERLTFTREGPDRFRARYELSRDEGRTWGGGDEQVFLRRR